MAQVAQSALHQWQNGETVTDAMLTQNDEVLRVAINDIDSKVQQNTASITQLQTQKADKSYVDTVNAQVQANTAALAQKADKTYVDSQIAFIQNGQIADNAVSTAKIQTQAVTRAKIADRAIDDTKVDTNYVPTNATMTVAINNAKAALQAQIDAHTASINSLQSQINTTNTRIDNLQYNRDLDSARMDILTLTFLLQNLTGAVINNMTGNIVTEDFADMSDWTIISGLFDSANRKFYLP